jgi:hypothetical protein
MNISLLRLLVGDDHKRILADIGYDSFVKLQSLAERYVVIGE